MSLAHRDVFDVPLAEIAARARTLASAPTQDAFDALWAEAMERETEARMDALGMTIEEMEALDRPRTAFGRLWERIEDWWWAMRREPAEADHFWPLAAPLLAGSRPLQEVPGDYDEIDEVVERAIAAIEEVVGETGLWTKADTEAGVDAPRVWHREGATLALVVLGEDPKIMGLDLRLARMAEVLAVEAVNAAVGLDEDY